MRDFKLLAVALLFAAGLTGLGALTWGKIAQGAEKSGAAVQSADAQSEEEEAHGWLGLALVNLTPRLAERIGVSISSGAAIIRVVHDGPADKSGLKRGDVITAVNGDGVASVRDVKHALKDLKDGDTVTLSITNRDGSRDVQVTAEARPSDIRPHPRGPRPHFGRFFGPRPHFGRFFGPAAGLLPELREIPRDERFEHLLGAEYRFTDKDGNPLNLKLEAGTVASSDASNLTVNLNGGGQQQFSLTGEVKFLPRSVNGDNIEDGAKVVVTEVNGDTRLVVNLDAAREAASGGRRHGPGTQQFRGRGDFEAGMFNMFKELEQERGARQGAAAKLRGMVSSN